TNPNYILQVSKEGINMELFKVEPVIPGITRIKMPYVCSYIVKGSDRAVLIDTGFGYGDLKSVVDELIDLPYDVICSHGHPDHAGGIDNTILCTYQKVNLS